MHRLLWFGIALVIVGVAGLIVVGYYDVGSNQARNPRATYNMPGNRYGPGPNYRFPSTTTATSYKNNGERIFQTGTSVGDTISATGGPTWFRMHNGGCAQCHGSDGHGRQITMMGSFEAPDIRYKTLSDEFGKAVDKDNSLDSLIKRAITRGVDENGESLSQNMPHWTMSESDLNDIISYLKSLDS